MNENNQEEIQISFETAPKCETCRLVATEEVGTEIHLSVLHYEEGFVYFNLSDAYKQREDIQKYIKELEPKIQSGAYHTKLVDMEKEAVAS